MPVDTQEFIPPRQFHFVKITDADVPSEEGNAIFSLVGGVEHDILVPINLTRSAIAGRGYQIDSLRLSYRITSGSLTSMDFGLLRRSYTDGAAVGSTSTAITVGKAPYLAVGSNVNNIPLNVDTPSFENADSTTSVVYNLIITLIGAELTTIEFYGLDVFYTRESSVLDTNFSTRLDTIEAQLVTSSYTLPTVSKFSSTGNTWNVSVVGSPTGITVNSGSGVYLSGTNWFWGFCTINVTASGTGLFEFDLTYPPVPLSTLPGRMVGAGGGVNGSSVLVCSVQPNGNVVSGFHVIGLGSTGGATYDLNIWLLAGNSDFNGSPDVALSTTGTTITTLDITGNISILLRQDNLSAGGIQSNNPSNAYLMSITQVGIGGHPSSASQRIAYGTAGAYFTAFAGTSIVGGVRINTSTGTALYPSGVYAATISNLVDCTVGGTHAYYHLIEGYLIIYRRNFTLTPTLNTPFSFEMSLPPGMTIDGQVWGVCSVDNDSLCIPAEGSTNGYIKFTSYVNATVTPTSGRSSLVVFCRIND